LEKKMSLKEKVEALKAASAKKMPPEALKVIGNAVASLKNSGILDRALKTDDRAPQFELQNAEGVAVNSADILKKGPMVLTFYRGAW